MDALIAVGVVIVSIIGLLILWGIFAFLSSYVLEMFGFILVLLGVVGVYMVINAIMNDNVGEAVLGTIFALIGGAILGMFLLSFRS